MENNQFTLSPLWQGIQEVKEGFHNFLKNNNIESETLEYSDIVCVELLENSVKYGVSSIDCPSISISFKIREDEIYFVVSNGVVDSPSLQSFVNLVQTLLTCENRDELYLNRLNEVASNPKAGSQLGIYRIFCDTGYTLNVELNNTKLTIIAKRKIH
jgi:hypothetical protein